MIFLKRIFCLLVISLVFLNLIGHEGNASDDEITLREAIDMGFEKAKEWNANATLTSVNRVDETRGGSRGERGEERGVASRWRAEAAQDTRGRGLGCKTAPKDQFHSDTESIDWANQWPPDVGAVIPP